MVREPSARGRAARTSDPPPRLGMPNNPAASSKTISGTGAPVGALENRSWTFPSRGRLRNASRVTLRNASIRLTATCSSIVALLASVAADVIE